MQRSMERGVMIVATLRQRGLTACASTIVKGSGNKRKTDVYVVRDKILTFKGS